MFKKVAFYTVFLLPLILSFSKADVVYLTDDTMKVGGGYYANDLIQVNPGDRRVPVVVYLRNTFDIAGFTLRLVYDSTIIYPYSPVSDSSYYQPIRSINLPVFVGTFSTLGEIYFTGSPIFNPNTEFIAAGRGPIVEFYFNIRSSAPQGYYPIKLEEDTLNQPPYDNTLGDKLGQHIYIPVLANGAVCVGNCAPLSNHSPVIASVSSKSVVVGDTLTFSVSATDADNDPITLFTQNLPAYSTFDQVQGTGTVTGIFTFIPFPCQAPDTFRVIFIAKDRYLSADTETVTIFLVGSSTNHPPVISSIGDKSIEVGDTLTFSVSATDVDNDLITLFAQNLRAYSTFDQVQGTGSVTGIFRLTPPLLSEPDTFNVTFIARDPCSLADTGSMTIFLQASHRPILDPIPDGIVDEGDTLIISVHATDPDGTIPDLSAGPLPSNSIFTDSGNGNGVFIFTPEYGQSGVYEIYFTASDGLFYDYERIWVKVVHRVVSLPNDTLRIGEGYYANNRIYVTPGQKRVPITVYLRNTLDIAGFFLGLVYDTTIMDPSCNPFTSLYCSSDTVGSCCYSPTKSQNLAALLGWFQWPGEIYLFGLPPLGMIGIDPTAYEITAGEGPIVEFYFDIKPSAQMGSFTTIKFDQGQVPFTFLLNTLIDPESLYAGNPLEPLDPKNLRYFVPVLVDCSVLVAYSGDIRIGCVDKDINGKPVDPCDLVEVPILFKTSDSFGAFDIRISFDPTVLYLKGVERGSGLPEGWEYFTYRQLPCPMCGCCKQKILILGLYDLNNTHQGVPIGASQDYVEIAKLKFQVACDQNLSGLHLDVCFEFDDATCVENSFSDISGNMLHVSNNPNFFNNADCDTQFHGNNLVARSLNFALFSPPCTENPYGRPCGGVLVRTTDEKKRGDINLNLIAYEVGDAVLFSSYFIRGTSVFTIDPPVQIANTDINADGFPLSLSDFVLMLRIMVHDATPIPKPTPGSDLATIYAVSKGSETKISTNANLGAALFVFEGDVKVNTSLKNEQGVVNNQTRVLVYMNSSTGITGQLLTAEGKLVSVEAVDNFSRPVKTTVVNRAIPTAYALNPNYPNPFNPTTNISFALPIDSKVSLKIYNVAGQLVRTLVNETMVAGTHTVTWNGANSNGEKVASGIYFYKLNAGDYSKTMKMVIMK